MKRLLLIVMMVVLLYSPTPGQRMQSTDKVSQAIIELVDQYVQAREQRDTVLLKRIITDGMDQLVSSGTWRRGKATAVQCMLRSSTRNPGKRTITVEHIRLLNEQSTIADARYEIENADGSVRKMWSTFIVVFDENRWKIAAIRNMLPAG